MQKVTSSILNEIYKERSPDARKYDFGLLLVIGGSRFYSGAPALSALAAFRAGVDMVRIIAPQRAADIIASFSPVLASYPLQGDWLRKKHLAILLEMTKAAQEVAREKVAVVIGGGLGRSPEVQLVVSEYLSQISAPAVIDADGIYALAGKLQIIQGKPFVFTPHAYEFFMLTGKEVSELSEDEKIKVVQQETARLNTTILLKGKTDIISDGKGVALNTAGSPYMTVGGTGDTLAGICGALLARGVSPFLAAQAAAYINGKAGEIAAEKKKEGFLATDLIEVIPEAIQI
jgi:hydroxyethylthiazole kinase-like uncharacterized protein yjeF